MAEEKRTIAEWEERQGMMMVNLGDYTPDSKVTLAEFLADFGNLQGVSHRDRVAFLEANGYEVTRENMLDPTLSARQASEAA